MDADICQSAGRNKLTHKGLPLPAASRLGKTVTYHAGR